MTNSYTDKIYNIQYTILRDDDYPQWIYIIEDIYDEPFESHEEYDTSEQAEHACIKHIEEILDRACGVIEYDISTGFEDYGPDN